jgi:hypothetical protein
MSKNLRYKIFILWLLLSIAKTHKTEAQIIVRLWEAEASVNANIIALALIKQSEVRVKNKMTDLINEIRKKIPYFGAMAVFNPIFQIDNTIARIDDKLENISQINNRVPLLFNRKKRKNTRKYTMYTEYLTSLNRDIDIDISNNGNLLKTSLEIVSELEEIENDLDVTLENLPLAERLFNLF